MSATAALDRLERRCPAAATLFRACAFLGADDVPVWLFDGGVDELPAPLVVGAEAGAEAFTALVRASLARKTSPDAISIDPLLQAAVRAHIGEGRRAWVGGVVRLVARAYPDEDDGSASMRSARLAPHALAVTGHEEAAATEPLATGWLLDRVATHEQGRGRVAESRRLLQRALAVAEAAYGPDDPVVARRLANLALLLQDTGEFGEARRRFERAVAIGESAYGPDDPEVGRHLANLAVVLHDLGELARARAFLERALRITEAAHGPDHPAVAGVLNNLGGVLGDLGAVADARRCFERALTIGEARLGPQHPAVCGIRANQAQLMRTMRTTD